MKRKRNWSNLVPKIEAYAVSHTEGNLSAAAKHFKVAPNQYFTAAKKLGNKTTTTQRTTITAKGAKTLPTPTLVPVNNTKRLSNNMVAIMVCPVANVKEVVQNLWE